MLCAALLSWKAILKNHEYAALVSVGMVTSDTSIDFSRAPWEFPLKINFKSESLGFRPVCDQRLLSEVNVNKLLAHSMIGTNVVYLFLRI